MLIDPLMYVVGPSKYCSSAAYCLTVDARCCCMWDYCCCLKCLYLCGTRDHRQMFVHSISSIQSITHRASLVKLGLYLDYRSLRKSTNIMYWCIVFHILMIKGKHFLYEEKNQGRQNIQYNVSWDFCHQINCFDVLLQPKIYEIG